MSLSLRRYCQHVHYLALTLSSGRNHIGSQYVIYWLSKGNCQSTTCSQTLSVTLFEVTYRIAPHSARPPAAQRRTSFLSHSVLSAFSLATASAFNLAVSSYRSASIRATAAACVCAARTAHDLTKA